MSGKSSLKLLLTQRALRDIQDIAAYSKEHWGNQATEKYLDQLEAGLERLKENPDLLRPDPGLHSALMFYRVNKHLFVCDAGPNSMVVLTVIHASMDIPALLAELQPSLAAEVELLHRKLQGRQSKKR